jgi:hypothetical protein
MACLLTLALSVGLLRPALAEEDTANAGIPVRLDPTGQTTEQTTGRSSQRQTAARRLLAATEAPMTVAQAPSQVVYVTNCPAAPPAAESSNGPLWVAVIAILVAGAAVGIMYARQSTDVAMPTTTFGTKNF